MQKIARPSSNEEEAPVIKSLLGIAGAAAIVLLAASFANVSAETKAPKPAACNAMKEEFQCKDRNDCQWVAAVVDSKTGKEKRKAYCRKAPPAKKK
jgi:hypothetical protein